MDDINQIAWHEILNPQNNFNEKLRETINILTEIVDKHAPIRLASQCKQKQLNKPWLTKAIFKSVKRKQKMYRTHYLSNDSQKKREYKHAAILSHLKNTSKTDYYSMQFSKYNDNLKQTWKLIGTLVKRKTRGQTFPTKKLLIITGLIHKKRTLLNYSIISLSTLGQF